MYRASLFVLSIVVTICESHHLHLLHIKNRTLVTPGTPRPTPQPNGEEGWLTHRRWTTKHASATTQQHLPAAGFRSTAFPCKDFLM